MRDSRPPPDSRGAASRSRLTGILRRADDSLLAHLLLALVVLELAVFRLAVPALLPPGDQVPPLWHQSLTWVGLYLFYFATAFAAAVIVRFLYQHVRRGEVYPAPFRYLLTITGSALVIAAVYSQLGSAGDEATFALDTVFTLAILVVVAAQISSRGDLGARIGIVLVATPLIIHFWAPFALRFVSGDDIGLPLKVQIFGQWSLVFAALATPYCFAPRPFSLSAGRVPPLVVAVFVAVIGSIIVRRSYEVGMELASKGLGVDLGPGAPTSMLALYIMALAAVTWTLVACLSAEAPARRLIGAGLGLVFFGGYAFVWSLQYLLGFAGLLIVGGATVAVRRQESQAATPGSVPVDDATWHGYINALVEALRARRAADAPGAAQASSVTVRGEQEVQRTHVVWRRGGVPLRLTCVRSFGRLQSIDFLAGRDAELDEAPGWTLGTRPAPDRHRAHPAPPPGPVREVTTGEPSFDGRFAVLDDGEHTATLFSSELRARAAGLLDGWMAYWPRRALRYRLLPGLGAPAEHPIPVSELAVRGSKAPPRVNRMLELLELLEEISLRGVDPEPASTAEPDILD